VTSVRSFSLFLALLPLARWLTPVFLPAGFELSAGVSLITYPLFRYAEIRYFGR